MVTLVIPTWFIILWAFALVVNLFSTLHFNRKKHKFAETIAEELAPRIAKHLKEKQDCDTKKKCSSTQKPKSPSQKSQKK